MLTALGFLVPFGLLTSVCAAVIGIAVWWPVAENRNSVVALLYRLDWEHHNRPLREEGGVSTRPLWRSPGSTS